MNYGEQYAFWYLRLNGFFPISNFVIHKSSQVEYSSDCDVLAIRPPNVYEEIGGKDEDWDNWLKDRFNLKKTIGIICEVKTGVYNDKEIFNNKSLVYCIGRMGIVSQSEVHKIAKQLCETRLVDVNDQYQIGKILIANRGKESNTYFYNNLKLLKDFIRSRVEKYPAEKYRDRMFFDSLMVQRIIDEIN